MNTQLLKNKFESLPQNAKEKVIALIESLNALSGSDKKNKKKSNFSNSKFFGMWKNREDMEDVVSWVRKIRKGDWKDLSE